MMHGVVVGASMGFDHLGGLQRQRLAGRDGRRLHSACREAQPVLRALRKADIHVVALHTHMMGEQPTFHFTHFWGKGKAEDLARAFRAALDAQAAVKKS